MMEAEDYYDMDDSSHQVDDDSENPGIDAISPLDHPIKSGDEILSTTTTSSSSSNNENHKRVGGAAVAGGFTGALLSVPLVAVDVTVLAIAGPIVAVAAAGGCAYMAAAHPDSAKDLIRKGGDAMKEAGDNWKNFHDQQSQNFRRESNHYFGGGGSSSNEETKESRFDDREELQVDSAAAAESKMRFVWPFQKEQQGANNTPETATNSQPNEDTFQEAPLKSSDVVVQPKKLLAWSFLKKESFATESLGSTDVDLDETMDAPSKQRMIKSESSLGGDDTSSDGIPDLLSADSEEDATTPRGSCGKLCLPWSGKCDSNNSDKGLSPRKEGENLFQWIHKNISDKKTIKRDDDEQTELFEDEEEEEEELTFGNDATGSLSQEGGSGLFSNEGELVLKLS